MSKSSKNKQNKLISNIEVNVINSGVSAEHKPYERKLVKDLTNFFVDYRNLFKKKAAEYERN